MKCFPLNNKKSHLLLSNEHVDDELNVWIDVELLRANVATQILLPLSELLRLKNNS